MCTRVAAKLLRRSTGSLLDPKPHIVWEKFWSKTIPETLKAVLQSLLFLIAVVVFYTSGNVALQMQITIGAALWALAGIGALATLVWSVRERIK